MRGILTARNRIVSLSAALIGSDWLFPIKVNVIRSYQHNIYTEEVNKIALSADDDKRIILEDCVHTLAYGHYKTLPN